MTRVPNMKWTFRSRSLLAAFVFVFCAISQAKGEEPVDPDYTTLRAGYADCDVTPGRDVSLCGYAFRQSNLTPGNAGPRDPIMVRVLALRDHLEAAALISVDVAFIPTDVCRRARRTVADRLETDPSRVILAATHTHSGPMLFSSKDSSENPGAPAARYTEKLFTNIVETAVRAAALTYPVSVAVQEAPLGLGYTRLVETDRGTLNCWEPQQFPRRPPAPATDSTCSVLSLRQVNGPRHYLLWSTPFHPVVLGKTSRLVSADYPGNACRMINETLPGARSIFVLGACGETQPWIATQENPDAVDTVARAAASFVALLSHGTERVSAPDSGPLLKTVADTLEVGDMEIDLAIWKMGQVTVVASSIELFGELALRLRRKIGGKVILATCANGTTCYLPPAGAFDKGGYEVDAAARRGIAKGDGEALVDRIADMASRIGN